MILSIPVYHEYRLPFPGSNIVTLVILYMHVLEWKMCMHQVLLSCTACFNMCSCRCLAIGCSENLCIWEVASGVLLQKFMVYKGILNYYILVLVAIFFMSNYELSPESTITSLCYSPDDAQLAAGLASGEVQVFDIRSSSSLFLLPKPYVSIIDLDSVRWFNCACFHCKKDATEPCLSKPYSHESLKWSHYTD